jgi:riboflavin-specific deaminase-like protein
VAAAVSAAGAQRKQIRTTTQQATHLLPQASRARPFVAVTFAMTVDGKVTTRNFTAVDFTSREDKAHLIRQRALGDAVLIGHSTLRRDNVRLGIPRQELREQRIASGQPPYPLRVIVSNAGRIEPTLNIFQTDFAPIIIFSTTRMPRSIQQQLQRRATLHLAETGHVNLEWMLQQLHRVYGVKRVACEGGPTLFRSLLEPGLVDQLNLTVAPFLFGGKRAPTLTGLNFDFFPGSIPCSLNEMKVVGNECFLTYRIDRRTRVGLSRRQSRDANAKTLTVTSSGCLDFA